MNKEGRHQISNVCFNAGVPREAADSQEALLVLPWLASLTTPHPLPLPFMQKQVFLSRCPRCQPPPVTPTPQGRQSVSLEEYAWLVIPSGETRLFYFSILSEP